MSQAITDLLQVHIFGPIEKGLKRAEIEIADRKKLLVSVDLNQIPSFLSYKAALIRERMTLQILVFVLSFMFVALFIATRIEAYRMGTALREKEYILAPGVQDFVPVSVGAVPDSHVQNAVMEYMTQFGSFAASNIKEQYLRLADSMEPGLKIRFLLEADPWITKVKNENISQVMSVEDREIRSDQKGNYTVTAIVKKDTFINNESIGTQAQVIEMGLKLAPPSSGKRWFLEITSLTTTDQNAFKSKSNFQGGK